jgi:cyclopropane fatty-acyl-phospholipid synthase-like methyltransferase
MPGPTNLASKAFWEDDYFAGVTLPSRPSMDYPYERTLAGALRRHAALEPGQSVVEIGCAPARWLVWYAETFGARVTGIEYTDKGARISRENLQAAGHEGTIRQGDFFTDEVGGGAFDLVLSLGFIEHFDDLDAVFARHVDFVKPGGRIALGVPNFRGLTGLFQRWGDPSFLGLHNTEAMRPRRFHGWAAQHGLELVALEHLDSLDPQMVRVTRRGPAVVLLPLDRLRRARWTDRVNHGLFSSYMLGVFRRPA